MNYENAGDILPEKLLQEVKKYAAGKLLYVPQDNHKKAWGEVSGQRQALVRRNQMMLNKFLNGTPVCELSKEYFLSEETVKRIVYSKKDTNKLDYHPTTNSAKAYSEAGMLEEWIHTYLLFGRRNKGFSDGLRLMCRYYAGPLRMPLSLLSRSSGPEGGMMWRVDRDYFEQKVLHWMNDIHAGQDTPPLIVNYAQGELELNCGNPLLEALKRSEVSEYPVILWVTERADYSKALADYAMHV
ncbi:CD3324 family protein [Paenibacillus sp. FSL H7-0756]|uniref:CD3324 family protein n=1 Tax=unclassified Paenibacillus TaxID=185978 RepID=UPI0030FA6018